MAARGERGLGRFTGDPRRRGVREAIDGAAECGQIRWKGGFTSVRRDSQGGEVGATWGGRVGGGVDWDVCAIARDAAECRGYRCKIRRQAREGVSAVRGRRKEVRIASRALFDRLARVAAECRMFR